MSETPSIQSPTGTLPEPGSGLESDQYWCYHCDKRVAVETIPDLPDVVCCDCKNGFVESIAAVSAPTPVLSNSTIADHFIQAFRRIAQAAREDEAPPPFPSDPSDEDYLRIELHGWENEDDDGGDEENDDDHSVEVVHEENAEENISDGEDEVGIEVIERLRREDEGDDNEEEMRRRRRDVLRLRLRDFASRAASRRNRILDWAEILTGLEDRSIELRFQVPVSDAYVGNPGDYVEAAEYESLLQNLAERDSGAKRGAPPASKSAVDGLESVVIEKEAKILVCAICKDTVILGEITKNLPCGHGYHGECIVPWLESRNTCPVCRFELATDDPDYEEERKKRVVVTSLWAPSSGSSSSGGVGNNDFGFE